MMTRRLTAAMGAAFLLAASAQMGSSASPQAVVNGGLKAATCRDLLSDGEVRQATGLVNMALKPYDAKQKLNASEAHCRFDAGATKIEIGIRSKDQLPVYDKLRAAMASFKPVVVNVPGATATFLDMGGRGTNFIGFARTAEYGVSINGTVDGPRIADPKGATSALLRLVLSRI
jgi:hypothetical protein